MATHWVYEDEPENYARVHLASCGHCNDGAGTKSIASPTTAQWHPADSYADARSIAAATGRPVSDCGHCHPER